MTLAANEGVTATLHLALAYRRPWEGPGTSPDLAFDVTYDRTEARAGQEVTSTVLARRTSAQGHGMLLAEVGTPPGAEVDRAILADLVRDYRSGVYRYEVQPDRVVFYIWPWWGREDATTRFSFRFRPRYPIAAVSAPSSLVDYYNPDAQVVLPPVRFIVR